MEPSMTFMEIPWWAGIIVVGVLAYLTFIGWVFVNLIIDEIKALRGDVQRHGEWARQDAWKRFNLNKKHRRVK